MSHLLFLWFGFPQLVSLWLINKGEKDYWNWQFSNINKIAQFSRTNMKFSRLVKLFTVNKPTNAFYLEISYIFSYSRYY